jgi:hypothetical protein
MLLHMKPSPPLPHQSAGLSRKEDATPPQTLLTVTTIFRKVLLRIDIQTLEIIKDPLKAASIGLE